MGRQIYREKPPINYNSFEGLLLKRLSTQSQLLIRAVKLRSYGEEVQITIDFIEKLIKQYKIQKY